MKSTINPMRHVEHPIPVRFGKQATFWVAASDPVRVFLLDDLNYRLLLAGQPIKAAFAHDGQRTLDPTTVRFWRGGVWHFVIANETKEIVTAEWDVI